MRKLTLLLFFILLSCSNGDDSNSIDDKTSDPIVGEWVFVSENDYYCGTQDVKNERLADEGNIGWLFVFNEDGTYGDYFNGTLTEYEDQKGTWSISNNGIYALTYKVDGEPRTTNVEVIFEDDLMRFGVNDSCVEIGGESIYTYSVFERQ